MTMKRNLLILFSLIISILFCSNPFESEFSRIDRDRVRPLTIVCENLSTKNSADALPGENILVKAYFAGKNVSRITWQFLINDTLTNKIELGNFTNSFRLNNPELKHDVALINIRIPSDFHPELYSRENAWLLVDQKVVQDFDSVKIPTSVAKALLDSFQKIVHSEKPYDADKAFISTVSEIPILKELLNSINRYSIPAFRDLFISSLLDHFTTRLVIRAIADDGYCMEATLAIRLHRQMYGLLEIDHRLIMPDNFSIFVEKEYSISLPTFTELKSDSCEYDTIVYQTGENLYFTFTSSYMEKYKCQWFIEGNPVNPTMESVRLAERGYQNGIQFFPPENREVTDFTVWVCISNIFETRYNDCYARKFIEAGGVLKRQR